MNKKSDLFGFGKLCVFIIINQDCRNTIRRFYFLDASIHMGESGKINVRLRDSERTILVPFNVQVYKGIARRTPFREMLNRRSK